MSKKQSRPTYAMIKYDVFPFCLIYPLEKVENGLYYVKGLGAYRPRGVITIMPEEVALKLKAELEELEAQKSNAVSEIVAKARKAIEKAKEKT